MPTSFLRTYLPLALGLTLMPPADAVEQAVAPPAAGAVSPETWLLEQVRLGEATFQDALVQQSLHRLELMSPNNPQVLAARLRLALRQGNVPQAQQQLTKLQQIAPDAAITRQSATLVALTQPAGRQQLQQARLLATAGRLAEARAAYDVAFNGPPPGTDLALEYWRLVARLPQQAPEAIRALQTLDQQTPGNSQLRLALAQMLFSQDREAEGYAMLQKAAQDAVGRDAAGELWLSRVKQLTVTPQSLAALDRYLTVFDSGAPAEAGRQERARQQAMLADPNYQARLRGLAQIEGGGGKEAIAPLEQALRATPNDPALLGALGMAYARSGDRARAITLFEQAQKVDTNGFEGDKWVSLITSNRYWLLIEQGDKALQAKEFAGAERAYQQAVPLEKDDPYATLGLGDVALARNDPAAAERYYQQAQRIDPANEGAVRGLTNVYLQQSPEKALAFINGLSAAQRKPLAETLNRLQGDVLSARADQFSQQQQWREAADAYGEARRYAPDDVWLAYRQAGALRQIGQGAEADRLFRDFMAAHPPGEQQNYAYALYLSGQDQDAQALATLNRLPRPQWSQNMKELEQRLQQQQTLDRALALRAAGNRAEAAALLRSQPRQTGIDLTLADWALEDADYAAARQGYQAVLTADPANLDAQLGLTDVAVAQGDNVTARTQLQQLESRPATTLTLNQQRRMATAWQAVGDPQRAARILTTLKPAARQAEPGLTPALIFRDIARIEQQQGQYALAREDYGLAMVAGGITPTVPQDNDSYTRLTRNQASDDWLKRGIRADAADAYRQQDVTITVDHDNSASSGTPGYSDLSANTTMAQADMPLYGGHAFLRSDYVHIDAGTFETTDGSYSEDFGTCSSVACTSDKSQTASGASIAAGWRNDRWNADIGTTPLGFEVVDWVGGVSYSGDWRQIGWTATASRRPISSSLLAFAGSKDPNTGTSWGGVRATGVSLSGSYDQGGANGVWSDLSIHQITGKNVEDNQRERLMAGYYYKVINEDNRRATIGLNSMLWHYQKDLSGYSLGQGGYYSPQQYFSLAVPVNYRQRTDNWSWQLGGSVSWSRSKTESQRRYPLGGLIPTAYTNRDDVSESSSSTGIGYTLQAQLERRLTSHWTLGAGVDIQQAEDYTPSHFQIYIRYSAGGWQGDLDIPPQPLTPYADFK
jgi:Flp pilus assembly protein TadD